MLSNVIHKQKEESFIFLRCKTMLVSTIKAPQQHHVAGRMLDYMNTILPIISSFVLHDDIEYQNIHSSDSTTQLSTNKFNRKPTH